MTASPRPRVGAVPANCADDPGRAATSMRLHVHRQKSGTYMYHCHQEAYIHVKMGMYGALVIYNPTDAAAAHWPVLGKGVGGNLWGWQYDKDYVLLLSRVRH